MKYLIITTPIPPSVNNYLKYRVQESPYPPHKLFVQPYKSQETLKYETVAIKAAQQAIKDQKWQVPSEDRYVAVDAIFFFPKHGMDTNNHFKVPLDCLQAAGVYHNDSKVIEGAKRVYIDNVNPRVELRIYDTGFMGIFDSEDEYHQFIEDNCSSCSKNPNRCSVITKALENRLTGDISIYKVDDVEYNKCNNIKQKKGK